MRPVNHLFELKHTVARHECIADERERYRGAHRTSERAGWLAMEASEECRPVRWRISSLSRLPEILCSGFTVYGLEFDDGRTIERHLFCQFNGLPRSTKDYRSHLPSIQLSD